MERWVAKLIALLLIFSLTLFITLLPIKLKDIFERWGRKGQEILSYMMCFGGGVFFAIYTLHMGPDAQAIVQKHIVEPHGYTYPIGPLLISVGFFLMVFTEKIVHQSMKRTISLSSVSIKDDEIGKKLSDPQGELTIKFQTSLSLEDCYEAKTGLQHKTDEKSPYETQCLTKPPDEQKTETPDHHGHGVPADMSKTRSILLLLALSLHHIFEGVSVGLKNSVTGVWNLTIAILSHEIVIAFSLGLQLVKAYTNKKWVIAAALVCTSMVPVGIAIGMTLVETGNGDSANINVANGILQSISTGVFIYITFFEILAHEILLDDGNLIKPVFILIGFITMALLAIIPEEKDPGCEGQTNSTWACT